MKKILSVMLFAIMALSYSNVMAQEIDKLPMDARNYINQHFANETVSRVKMDDKLLGEKKYEVTFSNGMEVEFDGQGNWREIDMKNGRMPVSVYPATMGTYIKDNHGTHYVTKIKRDGNGYKAKLNNGDELKFDHNGTFLRLDD